MKRPITTMSLDTSTRNTGYCVFKNGKIIKTVVISTKTKEPLKKQKKMNPNMRILDNKKGTV